LRRRAPPATRRIQERDESLTEMTKTEAGTRNIPMSAVLREMLLAAGVACPLPEEGQEVAPRVSWTWKGCKNGRSRGSAAAGPCFIKI
jgi:hypothetical protein